MAGGPPGRQLEVRVLTGPPAQLPYGGCRSTPETAVGAVRIYAPGRHLPCGARGPDKGAGPVMNDPYKRKVQRRFERDAQSFDAIYRLERSPFWRLVNTTLRKAVFERYAITFERAGDVTGKDVLDVGCGSGVYSVDFARRGARRVVGRDFSPNLLAPPRTQAAPP